MNDWQTRVILGLVPIFIAFGGWLLSLESRIEVIDARQQERTTRIANIEESISNIVKIVNDPGPKPETKVAIDGLRRDIDNMREDHQRIDERLSNLHSYLLNVPSMRPPFKDGRRGELILEYPQRHP